MNSSKAKNTDNFDYTERHVDQMSMVVVKIEGKACGRFEKTMVDMLKSGLNGLMFPTCDGDILRADIETVLNRLEARLGFSYDVFSIE